MAQNYCAVVGCNNSYRKLKKWREVRCDEHENQLHRDCACLIPFKLHKFPKKLNNRQEWAAVLNRKNFIPRTSSVVCSIHFIDGHPTNRNPNPALKLGYERKIKVEDYNDDDGEEDCKDGILNQVPQDDEAQAITIVPMRKAPPMKTRSRTVPLTNETPYGTVMNTVVPLRDEYATYGEHVANKLRKLEDHDRAIAQHKINNILFEAEMGRYRNVLS